MGQASVQSLECPVGEDGDLTPPTPIAEHPSWHILFRFLGALEISPCSRGTTLSCCLPPHHRPATEGGISEVEIISQQVDEETKSIAPVQLVNFAYRDLPLAAADLSTAGSQLLSNLDEDYQREG